MDTDTTTSKSPQSITPASFSLIGVYFFAWSLLLIRFYMHGIDPDGTSYISLALKYLHGDFSNVVSGHWSPLISWILVPFLATGLDPILSHKIASIIIGALSLVAIEKLMAGMAISRPMRQIYLVALCPVLAWYAESSVMADMLCACVVLYYLHAVLHDNYLNRPYHGILVGFLGALSYLAKSYNFYFFLLHFACINACYWGEARVNVRIKTLGINIASALVVFLLVSGCWFGLLSAKYHTLTVSTAGQYNFSHIRPGHSTLTHPMLTDGLLPPPNATAFSVWEDPRKVKIVQWSPFSSKSDFIYYLGYMVGNVMKFLRGLTVNPILDLTVAGLAIFCTCHKLPRKTGYLLLSAALYPVGYFALYYDGQRYVLLVPILLYLVGAYLLDIVVWNRVTRGVKIFISLLLCISLVALTLVRMYRDYPDVASQNDLYRVSCEIQRRYDLKHANISSQNGDWYTATALGYFLGGKYFGRTVDKITDEQLRHDLQNNKIDYHLVFGESTNHLDILAPVGKFRSAAGEITICRVTSGRRNARE